MRNTYFSTALFTLVLIVSTIEFRQSSFFSFFLNGFVVYLLINKFSNLLKAKIRNESNANLKVQLDELKNQDKYNMDEIKNLTDKLMSTYHKKISSLPLLIFVLIIPISISFTFSQTAHGTVLKSVF